MTKNSSRCFDFAEVILHDSRVPLNHYQRCVELAALIQITIEDWVEENPPICIDWKKRKDE